jgi:hypothetical protein
MARTSTGRPGVSLAKGPIAILGMAGIAFGVLALIFGGHGFAMHAPHGAIGGDHFIGVLTNGWTDLLFIAAGVWLLMSAPSHWGAKFSALVAAVALGAAAVIADIRGNGVFGIFAANHRTEIVWGAAAIVLFLMALMPRVGRRPATTTVQTVQTEPVATEEPRATRTVTDERAADGRTTDSRPAQTPAGENDTVTSTR